MITTCEELNALPDGTVILDRDAVMFHRQSGVWEPICAEDRENLLGSEAVPAVVIEQPAPEPKPVGIDHTVDMRAHQLAAAREEISDLEKRLTITRDAGTDLAAQVRGLEAKNTRLTERLERKDERIRHQRGELARLNAQVREMFTLEYAQKLRAEIAQLREKLVWQEAEIARLVIDRDQARQENAQVMADYTDLQDKLADSMDLEKPIRSRSDNAFNTYQEKTAQTAIYPEDQALQYLIPALNAEAGEVAGKWAKIIRDQGGAYDQADADAIIKEVGDVLWMIARIAAELGVDLEVVADRNLQKLADRKKRGVLGGSGDHR